MYKFIFSDIDGCIVNDGEPNYTQINHHLQRALARGFTVVLSTAKTAHEVMHLNKFLNLPGPFIIENGAGILFKHAQNFFNKEFIPINEYQLLKLVKGKPSLDLLLSISGADTLFTQMNDEQLCAVTGLSVQDARLAKKRYFTEPIYIEQLNASNLKLLKFKLRKAKLYFVQTKRFLHTTLSQTNHKAAAIQFLLKNYYANKPCQSFAIGDSINDYSMLNLCEKSFLLTNKHDRHYPSHWQIMPEIKFPGWQMAMEQMISQTDII